MEIALQAPFDGTVAELDAAEGQQVPLGRALFRVVAADDAPGVGSACNTPRWSNRKGGAVT